MEIKEIEKKYLSEIVETFLPLAEDGWQRLGMPVPTENGWKLTIITPPTKDVSDLGWVNVSFKFVPGQKVKRAGNDCEIVVCGFMHDTIQYLIVTPNGSSCWVSEGDIEG